MVEPILVIGAGGFVGKHLVRAFAERGTPVIAVTRRPVDFNSPDVEAIYGELNEPEQFLPLVARASAVLHLASCSTPGSTAGQPLVELNSNLRPTLSLLESMQKLPHKPLLYLSSGGSLYTSERPIQQGKHQLFARSRIMVRVKSPRNILFPHGAFSSEARPLSFARLTSMVQGSLSGRDLVLFRRHCVK
jgi:nucleoside-diphosphate-sugar epimerase